LKGKEEDRKNDSWLQLKIIYMRASNEWCVQKGCEQGMRQGWLTPNSWKEREGDIHIMLSIILIINELEI